MTKNTKNLSLLTEKHKKKQKTRIFLEFYILLFKVNT